MSKEDIATEVKRRHTRSVVDTAIKNSKSARGSKILAKVLRPPVKGTSRVTTLHGAEKKSLQRHNSKVRSRIARSKGRMRARKALAEMMDAHYSPYALSGGSPIATAKKTVKKVAKKATDVAKREIVAPAKSIKRALYYKKKAHAIRATGRIGRAAEMSKRANAVLRNRGTQLGAAAVGTAAAALPVPGAAEVGAVLASKAAKKVTSKLRARHVLRTATA